MPIFKEMKNSFETDTSFMLWKDVFRICYPEDNDLRRILLQHSQSVAIKSLQIVSLHPELNANRDFIINAAMLHDIGIKECDAPGIHCHGTNAYIQHGILGARILRAQGVDERYARVCERHTGTGITREDIASRHLPLPLVDLLPETIEEQIICYADKFYSKSHPERTKTIEQARNSILKFSDEGLKRFDNWVEMFE